MGHVLMKNRNGLVVDTETTRVSGQAQRLAALEMVDGVANEADLTPLIYATSHTEYSGDGQTYKHRAYIGSVQSRSRDRLN